MGATVSPISYNVADAAAAVGVSPDVIRRAIRAGDLSTASPKVGGRRISRPLIPADELRRWALNVTA